MAYKKYNEKNYSLEQLKNKALYYINYRIRTKKEVITKLKQLKALPENISIIIEELERLGLIDDEKFIAFFIREYIAIKKFGLSRVKLELQRIGFDSLLIQDHLQNYLDQEEYFPEKEAFIVIEQKYHTRIVLPEDHKIIAFLGRRGFPYSIAINALNHYKKSLL